MIKTLDQLQKIEVINTTSESEIGECMWTCFWTCSWTGNSDRIEER